jgi:hypothetical protein
MNFHHHGGLDKIAKPTDLRKATVQSDNLSDAAARAMQAIRQAITEAPADEALQVTLSRFMAAWSVYNYWPWQQPWPPHDAG